MGLETAVIPFLEGEGPVAAEGLFTKLSGGMGSEIEEGASKGWGAKFLDWMKGFSKNYVASKLANNMIGKAFDRLMSTAKK